MPSIAQTHGTETMFLITWTDNLLPGSMELKGKGRDNRKQLYHALYFFLVEDAPKGKKGVDEMIPKGLIRKRLDFIIHMPIICLHAAEVRLSTKTKTRVSVNIHLN